MDKETFFNKVKNKNYNFSESMFINMQTPIEVVCYIHGLFTITPANMLYKNEGCKYCGIDKMAEHKSLTLFEFIKRARKVHGDKYDYSLVKYKNNKTPIKIICRRCETIFEQLPCNHLKGFGCICQKLKEEDLNGSNNS